MKKPFFIAGKTFKITLKQKLSLHLMGHSHVKTGNYIKFAPIYNTYIPFDILDESGAVIQSAGTSQQKIKRIFKDSTPINLSSIKIKRKVTMLKKLTNFVKGLKEPKKTYIRLGWIEVVGDEWTVTAAGKEALSMAILVEDITVEEYAKSELMRLEEEEGKCKK